MVSAQSQPLPPWAPKPDDVKIEATQNQDGEQAFRITFPAGATQACVVFTQQTGEGRPYAPVRCLLTEDDTTEFTADWGIIPEKDAFWTVKGRVHYWVDEGTDHARIVAKESTSITVTR